MATLTIYLHDKAFQCLKRAVPSRSHSRSVLNEATRFANYLQPSLGINIIRCDEIEARNLLLYIRNCPEVVAAVCKALENAGISVDDPIGISGESISMRRFVRR